MATMFQQYDGAGKTWNEDLLVAGNFSAKGDTKVRGTMLVLGDVNVQGALEVEKLLCAGRVKCTGKFKAQRSGYYKSLQTNVVDEDDYDDFTAIGLTD